MCVRVSFWKAIVTLVLTHSLASATPRDKKAHTLSAKTECNESTQRAQKRTINTSIHAHTQMIILLHLFTHCIQFAERFFLHSFLCEFYSKLTNLFLLDFSLFLSHVCIQLTFPNKFACVRYLFFFARCCFSLPIQWYSNMSLVTQIDGEKMWHFYTRVYVAILFLKFCCLYGFGLPYTESIGSVLPLYLRSSLQKQRNATRHTRIIVNKISERPNKNLSEEEVACFVFLFHTRKFFCRMQIAVIIESAHHFSNWQQSKWLGGWTDRLDACKNLHCHSLSFNFMRWF